MILFDQRNLAIEIGAAGLELVRLRIAVVGRSALDDVGDIDLLPRQIDRLQQLIQKLASGAHKGQALLVFVKAGGLADEQDLGLGRPAAGHRMGASAGQPARLAGAHLCAERLQIVHAGTSLVRPTASDYSVDRGRVQAPAPTQLDHRAPCP